MSYTDVAKELKKNIQILTSSFEQNNLQILNLTCKPSSYGNDFDMEVLVEIASIEGARIPSHLYIKINLYDEDGELFSTNETLVEADTFNGYDTVVICCSDNNSRTLDVAVKGRIYVTRV